MAWSSPSSSSRRRRTPSATPRRSPRRPPAPWSRAGSAARPSATPTSASGSAGLRLSGRKRRPRPHRRAAAGVLRWRSPTASRLTAPATRPGTRCCTSRRRTTRRCSCSSRSVRVRRSGGGWSWESADDGRTWSEPRRLPDGILGADQEQADHAGRRHAGSPDRASRTRRRRPSGGPHFERSGDLGRTWTRTESLAGRTAAGEDFRIIQPTILTLGDGELLALFRSRESRIAASRSSDQGRTWGPVHATGLPNPDAGVDGVTLADGRHLLVYNHKVRIDGAWAGSGRA